VAERSAGTVAIWALAALLGVFALVRLTGAGGDATGAPVRIERSPEAGGAAPAGPGGGAKTGGPGAIYVHVAGAVRRPGLVRVAPGARVAAAVGRAGGPLREADLTLVNLAARLDDGQQVVVPTAVGAAAAGDAAAGSASALGAAKPSLGTASADQLDEIDGIGPTLAERIVEYRTENGGFGSIEELQEVDGIGEKRFEALREALQP
jgi:competence protein ComEA